jgi:sulfite oxidase
MNGKPLLARHGSPVRSIVPGVLGARSVKWLDHLSVSDKESPCFYQQHDYKVLPPEAVCPKTAEKYWSQCPSMLDMPVNSCVAYPISDATITLPASGLVEVLGYAVPQGHHGPVTRVQVSGDEGKTWTDAHLEDGGEEASRWSWVLWNAKIRMERGEGRKIFAKATDAGGNSQTQEQSTWNLRGVAYNGYEAVFNLKVVYEDDRSYIPSRI